MFAIKDSRQKFRHFASSNEKQQENSGVVLQQMTNTSLFMQRYLGNSYLQSSAESPKASNQAIAGSVSNIGLVVQLQTDPTRPKEMMEELSSQEGEEFVEAAGASEEIEDTGEGVGSIEEGSPFGGSGMPEEQEESPASSPVQTKPDNQFISQPDIISPGVVLNRLDSGFPIDHSVRTRMEGFFGESFSSVNFHNGQQANALAASLGAQAFTIGNHVAFAEGKYQPDSTEGKKLIAHELTHVTQQRRGISGNILREGIGHSGDEFEMEADHKAEQMLQHENSGSTVLSHPNIELLQESQDQGIFKKGVIQLFSGSTAAAYAKKWATSTNEAYGRFGNDCTNFASQAMEAGEWAMIVGSGYCAVRTKDSVWWFKKDGCDRKWPIPNVHASHTWGGAQNFYNFVKASGRGTTAKVADLNVGDVLQMDFSGGGHIGHTMVVTKKTKTNLFFSYHTSDHLDEPFWGKRGILARNPDPPTKYHGWNIT
ncbi:MAG: DUF4157 domain-containing protein [Methylococcales bacterium]|nr:DUF4157 domain-containing protein [Methylococcales bacterium]